MNVEIIKQKLLNYKYISFDIFDTLLVRSVDKPEDVFDVVETNLKNKNIKLKNFKKKRNLLSFISHKFYKHPNIYQIYRFLLRNNKIKEEIIVTEINTEFSLINKNELVFELYDYCLKNNKNIIITSDMYLPENILKELLNENGYFNFKKLYVSCDVGCAKNDATIYDFILKDLNITNKDIIHIGDNYDSDIINSKNIDAIHVKKNGFDIYEKN